MAGCKADRVQEKVMGLVGELTPEQTAQLAGKILLEAGISRTTLAAFMEPMTEEDLWEFSEQVPGIANEMADVKAAGDDDEDEDDDEGE